MNSDSNGVLHIPNPECFNVPWIQNEPVAWVVEDNEPQRGIVRWVGYKLVSDRLRNSPVKYWLVGIELVSFISIHLFI